MKYTIFLSEKAEEQLDFLVKSGDKPRLKKIKKLLDELEEHPETGSGNPERLKHELSGYWSRRIDSKNRMVYSINNNAITVDILSVKGHYLDK
ncbi:MAG: Txe/YoeB family addiction module toxin [Bacteroidales bacterium]|jgi:toxin YoeB|nr:Txe/YoeB family addiction module toxin [Bacteroidales bacterium]